MSSRLKLILEAYGIKFPDQLVGLPQWAYEETFDIEARLDEDALPAYQKFSERERREQAAPMLRSMLADRFKLTVHRETKELPVYALVIAKSGFKLNKSQVPENLYGIGDRTRRRSTFLQDRLALASLSDCRTRPAAPSSTKPASPATTTSTSNGVQTTAACRRSGPTLFTALEEQLGLRLVSTKAPVDVLSSTTSSGPQRIKRG